MFKLLCVLLLLSNLSTRRKKIHLVSTFLETNVFENQIDQLINVENLNFINKYYICTYLLEIKIKVL